MNIIYEDKYLIIAEKDYNQALNYKGVTALNNLSKEVSGMQVFLKNKEYNLDIKYKYYCIVEGYLDRKVLDCDVIANKEKYSIIEITSSSDNIIREKLMNINHSIIGDYRYRSTINPIKRICMHLYKIEIGKKIIISELPDSFKIFTK